MTAPTVNVTVNLSTIMGAPCAGVKVTAKLDQNDVYSGGIVISDPVTATANGSGIAVLALFPNNPSTGLGTVGSLYTFSAAVPGGKSFRATAQIPNSNCNLQDVMDLEPQPSLTAAQVAQSAAQGYAAAASTSAASASTSAGTATAVLSDTGFQAVAVHVTDIATVGAIAANVTTVAGIAGNVTTVAGDHTAINTVAGDHTAINTVAGDHAAIVTVAGDHSAIASVVANLSAINGAPAAAAAAATSAGAASDAAAAAGVSQAAAAASAALLAAVPNSYDGTRDPLPTDDSTQNASRGSPWLNTNTLVDWECTDNSVGAAVWVPGNGWSNGAPLTGQSIPCTTAGHNTGTAVPASEILYLYPVEIGEKMTLAAIVARIFTGGASSLMRAGIWAEKNKRPFGAPIVADNVGVSCATSSTQATFSATATLKPGRYWVGAKFGPNTATMPTPVSVSSTDYTNERKIGRVNLNGNTALTAISIANAWGTNLPTFAGGETYTEVFNSGVPLFRLTAA